MGLTGDMVYEPVVLLTAAVVGLGVLFWVTRQSGKKYKMPPGPTPLPLIGNLIELQKDPLAFRYIGQTLRKKYGDVLTLHVGTIKMVVLNSIDSVREALVRKQNDFAGRPRTYSGDLFTENGKDIAFGQFTPIWKLQRKIAHNAIRKFMSGSELERRVVESIDNLTEVLKKQKEPFDPLEYMTLLVYNILANVIFGKRWHLEDTEFQTLKDKIKKVTDDFGSGLMADFIPILEKLPQFGAARRVQQFMDWFNEYMGVIYTNHKNTYSSGDESDLIYHLIGTLKEAEVDGDSTISQLTDAHMFQIVNDMFFAGTDTSRFTLHWALCYLAAYPEVQDKLFREIDDICGDYPVTMEAKQHLHYTDAVLHEVLRLQPVVPVGIPHTTTCDTTIGPYEIPKDTWVIPNLWALHHDPNEWEDPESFKPERFLGDDGKMAPKPNSYLPFSSGRRVCVGEALAKSELLLALSLLCQRFSFDAPPGEKVVPENIPNGLACMSKPYKIVVYPRK